MRKRDKVEHPENSLTTPWSFRESTLKKNLKILCKYPEFTLKLSVRISGHPLCTLPRDSPKMNTNFLSTNFSSVRSGQDTSMENCWQKALRATKGRLISEPRLSTPCEPRLSTPCDKPSFSDICGTPVTVTPQQRISKTFQNPLKILNVYFRGDNVHFRGDNVYFWENRAYSGGCSKNLGFMEFRFFVGGGLGTLWVGEPHRPGVGGFRKKSNIFLTRHWQKGHLFSGEFASNGHSSLCCMATKTFGTFDRNLPWSKQ